MKPRLQNDFFITITLLSAGCLLCITAMFVFLEYESYKREAKRVREEYTTSYKNLLKSTINKNLDYVEYMRGSAENRLKSTIKSEVEQAYAIATNLYNSNENATQEELKKTIRESLRPIRFNDGRGYFYVIDSEGVMQLHAAAPATEGFVPEDELDEDGQTTFDKIEEVVIRQGEGFISYSWYKPEVTNIKFKKIAYVKNFEPLNWYIGTGDYLQDITKDIQNEVLARFSAIELDQVDQLLVGTIAGRNILNISKGKNNIWNTTGKDSDRIFQGIRDLAKKNTAGYFEYDVADKDTGKSVQKTVYVAMIPEWDWYIAAEVTHKSLDDRLEALQAQLKSNFISHLAYFLIALLLMGVGVYLISNRLSKKIIHSTDELLHFFDTARKRNAFIDPNSQFYTEFQSIAEMANEMITRRVEAEIELAKKNSFLHSVLDNNPTALCMCEGIKDNWKISYLNKKTEPMMGASLEDVLTFEVKDGRPHNQDVVTWKHYTSDDKVVAPNKTPIFLAMNEDIATVNEEYKIVQQSGNELSVLVSCVPIKGENDETIAAIASYIDISEHKKIVDALRKSETSLSSIFRAAPIGIGISRDRTLTTVNDKLIQMTGYSQEELVGCKTEMLYCDEAESERVANTLYRQVQTAGVGSTEAMWKHKDGSVYPVLLNGAFLDDGESNSIVVTVLDLTDKIEHEKHYRILFEGASDAILLIKNGVFVDCNETACKMFRTTHENMINSSPDMWSPDSLDGGEEVKAQANEKINAALAGEEQLFHWIHKRADGSCFDAEVGLKLVELGGEPYLQAFVRDISHHKNALRELKKSEEKFRCMVEDVGDRFCLFRYDKDGCLTYLSPGAKGLLGVDPETAVGNSWYESLHWASGSLEKGRQEDQRLISGEVNSVTFEVSFIRSDGMKRTLEATDHLLLNNDGEYSGIEGILVDVTDRARAEEELRLHTEGMEKMIHERTRELSSTVNELKTINSNSEKMARFNELLQVCETDEESYKIFGSVCSQLFAEHSGYLAVLDETTEMLVAVEGFGGYPWQSIDFDLLDCWSLRHGKPHVVDGALSPACAHMGANVPETSFCVPVEARGEHMGLLHVVVNLADDLDKKQREHKLQQELNRACRVAELYSLSLANIRLRDELREQSIRDALTGLFNRRHMEASLTRELDRAVRKETSLSVILLDVDHFKKFNDTYGHEVGDIILRKIGEFLLKYTRGEDIPCRYGGEELLVILPDCSTVDCVSRAEQIRKGISNLEVFHEGASYSVAVSLGVATFPEHGKTTDQLVGAADEALYRAKNNGRNRVEAAHV